MNYQQIWNLKDNCVNAWCIKRTDGCLIPFDPANTDYQAYLQWLAEGNTPEPSEEQQ